MRRLKVLGAIIVFGFALVAAFTFRRHSDDPLAGFLPNATHDSTTYYGPDSLSFDPSTVNPPYGIAIRFLTVKPYKRPQLEVLLREIAKRNGTHLEVTTTPLYSAMLTNKSLTISAKPDTDDMGIVKKYEGGNIFFIQEVTPVSKWDALWLRVKNLGRDPFVHPGR